MNAHRLHPWAPSVEVAVALTVVWISLATVVGAAAAQPEIVPVSQNRSVDSFAAAGDDSESDGADATDFGLFQVAISSDASPSSGDGGASGGGNQISSIGPSTISIFGGMFANAWGYDDPADASGASRCTFEFEVTETTPFTLQGCVEYFDSAGLNVWFTGPGGQVVDIEPEYNNTVQVDAEGVLMAGEVYELHVSSTGGASSGGYGGYAFGEFSLDLELVCSPEFGCEIEGDANGDGVVDTLDLVEIITNWGSCPPMGFCPADQDGDGIVGVLDLIIVIGNWS